VNAYGAISNSRVATAERGYIVDILSREFIEDVRRLAHDEDATYPEFEESLGKLKTCKKYVTRELERFKKIYESELSSLGMAPAPNLQMLSLPNVIQPWNLNIVREAAAAHNGQGIEWADSESHRLEGHHAAVVAADVGSPVALPGQCLLLDDKERLPASGDLVVFETEKGEKYVRRLWESPDRSISLEAVNVTVPRQPIVLDCGEHLVRRVVGVLFFKVNLRSARSTDEWAPFKLPDSWSANVVGLRIKGTSMEPLVRENQFALVRRDQTRRVTPGDLACVDTADGGTFIKRCYPSGKEWLLCSMNPNDLEHPIPVKPQDILHAYPLVGVLFEI